MLNRINPVALSCILIIALPIIGSVIVGCVTTAREVPDPGAGWIRVGEVSLQEVHPKPGVVCWVYPTHGISCIKE
jgi:hypothetical protein